MLVTIAVFLVDIIMEVIPRMRDIADSEIQSILSSKEVSNLLIEIKLFLYLLSEIFVCIVRRDLIKEERSSPLLSIDDQLNEELYKNIIQQSQFPDNEKFVMEYTRICDINKQNRISLGLIDTHLDKTDENINNYDNKTHKKLQNVFP